LTLPYVSLYYTNMYKMMKLMKLNEPLYHTDELAALWGITNRNTLTVSIHRYVKKGILTPIYRGLYATRSIETISPYRMGAAIAHRYCYVSTETVLVMAGVIFQELSAITFVSDRTQQMSVGGHTFRFRQMAPKFLHQSAGVSLVDGVLWASAERAYADLLYFAPKYYFDAPNKLDWKKVKVIQQEVGYDRQ